MVGDLLLPQKGTPSRLADIAAFASQGALYLATHGGRHQYFLSIGLGGVNNHSAVGRETGARIGCGLRQGHGTDVGHCQV